MYKEAVELQAQPARHHHELQRAAQDTQTAYLFLVLDVGQSNDGRQDGHQQRELTRMTGHTIYSIVIFQQPQVFSNAVQVHTSINLDTYECSPSRFFDVQYQTSRPVPSYFLVARMTATVHSTVIIIPFGLVSCTIFWISSKCFSNCWIDPGPKSATVMLRKNSGPTS